MTKDDQIRRNLASLLERASKVPARTVWFVRIVLFGLVIIWILGGMYLSNQVKEDEKRIEQSRIEAQRRQEFLRRGAQYKQDLQQRSQPSKVRNAFDGR